MFSVANNLLFSVLIIHVSGQVEEYRAVVELNVGTETNGIEGTLSLSQTGSTGAVRITGNIFNLPTGLHGIHVHASGDTTNGCTSVGGHFNPYNMTHGAPEDNIRHVGDLGNFVVAGPNGIGVVNIVDQLISLNGDNSIMGRAIVVHERADDLGRGGNDESKITGNAGSRLACGIVGLGA